MALAAVPGGSGKKAAGKKQKRRVSFAPPAELETMHLYQVQVRMHVVVSRYTVGR